MCAGGRARYGRCWPAATRPPSGSPPPRRRRPCPPSHGLGVSGRGRGRGGAAAGAGRRSGEPLHCAVAGRGDTLSLKRLIMARGLKWTKGTDRSKCNTWNSGARWKGGGHIASTSPFVATQPPTRVPLLRCPPIVAERVELGDLVGCQLALHLGDNLLRDPVCQLGFRASRSSPRPALAAQCGTSPRRATSRVTSCAGVEPTSADQRAALGTRRG